ncbi:MAG: iron export ABC transporter permease subunit FetB [Proteobacteria bacterium]|nr:iron export ABC transporter permease subunit FetB [Pseudomonadota bacterium]
MNETISLTAGDLALAATLVLVAGAVSAVLRLGLERRLLVAAIRTVVQLLLVGYVLAWVFALDRGWIVGLVFLFMAVAAGRAAVQRASHSYRGATWNAVVTLALTGLLTTVAVTAVVVGVQPWWRPQYSIPLLGMIFGNGLTGISLCLDGFLGSLADGRGQIEMELALGATRWEAVRAPLADAVRKGMIPILNSMTVVGIVSLPGMMTGQILAGEDPLDAVKYQIVVMFMLAAATSMGSIGIALLAYRRVFNGRHQLVGERIYEQK